MRHLLCAGHHATYSRRAIHAVLPAKGRTALLRVYRTEVSTTSSPRFFSSTMNVSRSRGTAAKVAWYVVVSRSAPLMEATKPRQAPDYLSKQMPTPTTGTHVSTNGTPRHCRTHATQHNGHHSSLRLAAPPCPRRDTLEPARDEGRVRLYQSHCRVSRLPLHARHALHALWARPPWRHNPP